MNMARPMRGMVRDALRRQFERAEERLRARIAALRGANAEGPPAGEVEE